MTGEIARIFLIEDNPADVELIEECLRQYGIRYELIHCDNIEAALSLANNFGTGGQEHPDLMLLDYNLPRGEARAVLQACSENPALAHMRRAVVTSSLAPKDHQEALHFGADAFISKPADLDGFLVTVGGKIAELLGQAGRPHTIGLHDNGCGPASR